MISRLRRDVLADAVDICRQLDVPVPDGVGDDGGCEQSPIIITISTGPEDERMRWPR